MSTYVSRPGTYRTSEWMNYWCQVLGLRQNFKWSVISVSMCFCPFIAGGRWGKLIASLSRWHLCVAAAATCPSCRSHGYVARVAHGAASSWTGALLLGANAWRHRDSVMGASELQSALMLKCLYINTSIRIQYSHSKNNFQNLLNSILFTERKLLKILNPIIKSIDVY